MRHELFVDRVSIISDELPRLLVGRKCVHVMRERLLAQRQLVRRRRELGGASDDRRPSRHGASAKYQLE